MSNVSPFPGFEAPAVGFDQPFEMLHACHDRVRRSLALLDRLFAHIDSQGHDAASRSAAADVLRYFDQAAPLHHQDEELHVFPVLLENGDAGQVATAHALRDEHQRMAALWSKLREPLAQWTRPEPAAPIDDAARALEAEFRSVYSMHLIREEALAFPEARALLDADDLAAMGREMAARRQAA